MAEPLKEQEKIKKLLSETEELGAETQRRLAVAQEKLAGLLIEKIQSEREKLKDKREASVLLGISQRINDLRSSVTLEILHNYPKTENGEWKVSISEPEKRALEPIVEKMIEAYGKIRLDLVKLYQQEDPTIRDFLQIKGEIVDLGSKLWELNLCLGQLSGYVLGRMAESVF